MNNLIFPLIEGVGADPKDKLEKRMTLSLGSFFPHSLVAAAVLTWIWSSKEAKCMVYHEIVPLHTIVLKLKQESESPEGLLNQIVDSTLVYDLVSLR